MEEIAQKLSLYNLEELRSIALGNAYYRIAMERQEFWRHLTLIKFPKAHLKDHSWFTFYCRLEEFSLRKFYISLRCRTKNNVQEEFIRILDNNRKLLPTNSKFSITKYGWWKKGSSIAFRKTYIFYYLLTPYVYNLTHDDFDKFIKTWIKLREKSNVSKKDIGTSPSYLIL